jgi:hypothetical protein
VFIFFFVVFLWYGGTVQKSLEQQAADLENEEGRKLRKVAAKELI